MGGKPRQETTPVRGLDGGDFLHLCIFCGQPSNTLVIGPRVSICEACVEMARDFVGFRREWASAKRKALSNGQQDSNDRT